MNFNKLKSKVKSVWDDYCFLLMIQFALFVATGLDFIVHSTLYDFGLKFDYAWVLPYWGLLALLFLAFGLISVSAYNVDRKRKDNLKSALVFSTVLIEYYGGFLDSLWFVLCRLINGNWGKAFQNWTWHPYSWFGFYNIELNLVLNVFIGIMLVTLWYWVLYKRKV